MHVITSGMRLVWLLILLVTAVGSGGRLVAANAPDDQLFELVKLVREDKLAQARRTADMLVILYPDDRRVVALLEQIKRAEGETPMRPSQSAAPAASAPRLGWNHKVEGEAPMEMIWVDRGSVLMGSEPKYEEITLIGQKTMIDVRSGDGRPVTRVTFSHGFWLGRTEVTQAQWRMLMEDNPSEFKFADRPVEKVSWSEAMEFCWKLTQRERAAGRLPQGYVYTLPTEAQWEYACRAGSQNDDETGLETMTWYYSNSNGTTHPVAQRQPNKWGFYDMHGNVAEWTGIIQHYSGESMVDPVRRQGDGGHARGGSHFNRLSDCRAAHRTGYRNGGSIGFRIALSEVRTGTGLIDTAPEAGESYILRGNVPLKMIWIAPGTFQMGNATGGDEDERPVTQVTLTRGFWLGEIEATQGLWRELMGFDDRSLTHLAGPVPYTSWDDAMEFCKKLTEREQAAGRLPAGHVYTLPTEAQWEYACRAGTTGDYAGNLDEMAWYANNSNGPQMSRGEDNRGGANAWGLYDMHGNMWEWCLDSYMPYPGGSVKDLAAGDGGKGRIMRGGGWSAKATYLRSANRGYSLQNTRNKEISFRVALAPVQ